MKLGEALVRATRNSGELLPGYSQHLLSALLTGVKDPEPLVRASSLSNLGDVFQLLRFSFHFQLYMRWVVQNRDSVNWYLNILFNNVSRIWYYVKITVCS